MMDFSAYVYCLLMAIAPWVPFKCNLCFLPFKVDHLCSNQAWHLYWVPLEWAWHVQLPAQQPFWHQVHLLINLGCRFLEWRDNIDFWRFIHPHQLWMLLEIESLGSQTLAAVYTTLQLWLCTMALVQAQVEFNTQLLKLNFKSYQVPSPFPILNSLWCPSEKPAAGHYTAFATNNKAWFNFNDCSVKETDFQTVNSCKAYILFYVQRHF